MSRPATISNQQILDAARAVFLARGFTKASTAEIARRAGVSEGSVFNRFSTKDELFRVAMDEELPPALTLEKFVGKGDARKNLERITLDSIRYLKQLLPTLMLRWSKRDCAPCAKSANRAREVLLGLTKFFADENALGRVSGDPQIAARLFMGAVWNYCFLLTITGKSTIPEEAFSRRLVAGLWQGIAPKVRTS